ncbi:GTP cyclohydrolase II RibA [Rhizobium sp. FY34]|uniref:GTP cyclohydrolase II RibA n=1 Tax=Rhizobium sp. FY34 TaxID=2562309 RepID=UPI0010BFC5A8|nr:GTP cyclohydrolase II RibA [Rhizobium sp. FY34]
MTSKSPFAIDFANPAAEVERAVSELRFGRPVIFEEDHQSLAVLALDAVTPALYDQFSGVVEGSHRLLLTRQRANRLGIKTMTDVTVPLAGMSFDEASRLSYALDAKRPGNYAPAESLASRSAELARTALLLPAMIIADISQKKSLFSACCSLHASRLTQTGIARQEFQQVVRTRVPLKDHGDCDFVVFRGGLAQKDQVAIVVGKPDVTKPVPIRVHSSCITGDLCGSLKCDCGDQLRNGLDLLKQAGGGVLIYLDQEGRGTGIGAKMRAYGYQHLGLDTIDADAELGLAEDHRRYEAALAMLRLLSISEVVVYTNNPTKIAALRDGGIIVHSRTAVTGRVTNENENYLRTKTLRAGHMLELDTLIAAE